MGRWRAMVWMSIVALAAFAAGPVGAEPLKPVDFDREIRPILSDQCFLCHGPDQGSREADLRLDTQAGLYEKRDDISIVAPGQPEQSELLRRILSEEDYEQMPPPDSNLKLSEEQKGLIRRWIAEGAPWSGHWSFQAVDRPDVPIPSATSPSKDWPRNPIDQFVLARLEQESLVPAPEADKERLLRRVKFDLTGLPPTLAELDAFLADSSEQAYEKMVDQFLASPHYGERMAWDWLDVARYADTNGFQGDRERTMWPWRDWVVQALNKNQPYDQFTVEQLAGDLLPDATPEQILATGFSRNHMINGEGGRIAEENRVEYVFDQAETMGTVWLGLTLNCCRCHDHKYDPLTQKNYYEFFDFFNQTPVTGSGGDPKMAPNLSAPTAAQIQQIAKFNREIAQLSQELKARAQQLAASQPEWEKEQQQALNTRNWPWHFLQPVSVAAEHQELVIVEGNKILARGENPRNDVYQLEFRLPASLTGEALAGEALTEALTALRLEAIPHESMTNSGLARSNSGNFVLTELELSHRGTDGEFEPLTLATPRATFEQAGFPVGNAIDGQAKTGWAVYAGQPLVQGHAALFHLASPLKVTAESQFRLTLRHDSPHAHHNLGYFRLSVSTQPQPELTVEESEFYAALAVLPEQRSKDQQQLIAAKHRQADELSQKLLAEQARKQRQLKQVQGQVPVVMVMKDQAERRQTHLLNKGLYSSPLGTATAAFPESIAWKEQTAERPLNRLDLAEWIVDPQNPLTARVTVNRHWQLFFGYGLVKTPEDFGAQGAKPTHPELLDWLAAEFVESGWDVKQLHKRIVLSATYRQSAQVGPEAYAADPENSLLSRGPRARMPSWMLRDQALAVSGLLVDRLGGPPVKPYQPAGIWAEATFGKIKYQQDSGKNLYRRTLYTFWRRIVGPTMLFDNSPRQSCVVQVYRTNTPLHALVTLNETTYVEAARALAQRILLAEFSDTDINNDKESDTGTSDTERVQLGWRLVTSRKPSEHEQQILLDRLKQLRAEFAAAPEQAEALLAVGESARDARLAPAEHAAWTSLCSLLLNLDEALSR